METVGARTWDDSIWRPCYLTACWEHTRSGSEHRTSEQHARWRIGLPIHIFAQEVIDILKVMRFGNRIVV